MKSPKLRLALVQLGAVLIALLPCMLLGWYLVQKHLWAQDRLIEIAPRYARLLGLDARRAELAETLSRVQAMRTQYVYPASIDAIQAGNAAQQRVRDVFSQAGLQIISSQVLPPKTDQGFDRITLAVRAESDLLSLQAALAGLTGQSPVILINDLDIRAANGGDVVGPVRLAVTFNLGILRVHP